MQLHHGSCRRSNHLISLFIAVLFTIVLAAHASGSTIFLNVPPAIVDQSPQGSFQIDFPFGDVLDGVVLAGQSISLDLFFADGILARIIAAGGFSPGLALQTNFQGFPGFVAEGSGMLLGPGGIALHDPLNVGIASSFSGQLFAGLFPNLQNFDMSGVHFDLILPGTGHEIIGGRLRLTNHAPWTHTDFGTIEQLPDNGPPLSLTALVLGSLLVSASWIRRRAGSGNASSDAAATSAVRTITSRNGFGD